MLTPFDPRAVEDGAVSGVHIHHLALENSSVFEREMKDVAMRRVRHGIKPYYQ